MLRGGASVNGLFPEDFSFLQLSTSEGFLENIWHICHLATTGFFERSYVLATLVSSSLPSTTGDER